MSSEFVTCHHLTSVVRYGSLASCFPLSLWFLLADQLRGRKIHSCYRFIFPVHCGRQRLEEFQTARASLSLAIPSYLGTRRQRQELEVGLVFTSTREVLPPNSGAEPSPTSSMSCFQCFPYVNLSALIVKHKDKKSVFTNGLVLFSS